VISFRSFTKRYGAHVAVEDLSLEVGRGEAVALLGPNGSGKTTCLKAAAGLVRPSAGGVWLGQPGLPAHVPEARRVLSYLPQRVAFPEALTGREVVAFFGALRGASVERGAEVLRFASLNGAGQRAVGTYSGGMVQRLGLAVALLPDAPALLLDEPTAALDPEGLVAFYDLVERRKSQGKTILFTSHHLGDAERLADRFALLVEGRLRVCLTHQELAQRLGQEGVLRLRLSAAPVALLAEVQRRFPRAAWDDGELAIPGPAESRAAAIELVRAGGGEILALTTEDGRLDALYRGLVGGDA
jgi:Cu-processing system ATP-binding protein